MEGIGQQILDQKLNQEDLSLSYSLTDANEDSCEPSDEVSLDAILLSQLLKEKQLNIKTICTASEEDVDQVRFYTEKIVNDFNLAGKGPSAEMERDQHYTRSYRVLTYSLLLLQQRAQNSTKYEKLRQKYKTAKSERDSIQEKYDNLITSQSSSNDSSALEAAKNSLEFDNCSLQSRNSQLQLELSQARRSLQKSDKLVSYLVTRFGLPKSTDLSNVLSQIRDVDTSTEDISHIIESDNFMHQQVSDLTQRLLEANQANEELISEKNAALQELGEIKAAKDSLEAELSESARLNDEMSAQMWELKIDSNQKNEKDTESDSRLFALETELRATQIRIREMEDLLNQQKDKCKKLKKGASALAAELRSKEKEATDLQMKNDKLEVDLFEAKAKCKEYESHNIAPQVETEATADSEKLKTALMELTEQFEQVTADLQYENETRSKLTRLIQRQNSAMTKMEAELKQTKEENDEMKERTQKMKEECTEVTKKLEEYTCNHSEVSKALINIIRNSGRNDELAKSLMINLSDEKEPIENICNAFETLFNSEDNATPKEDKKSIISDSDLAKKNDRLLIYLANLLHFMEQICDSGDVQEWLIGCIQPENFRERLTAQVMKVGSFIRDNGLADANGKICETYTKFPTFIRTIIDDEDVYKSEENRELVSLIQQFSFANEIICKFATELQERGTKIMGEVKRMRDELTHADQIASNKVDEETQELFNKLRDSLNEKEALIAKLEKLKDELRKSKDVSNLKCLRIINDKEINEEEEEDEEEEKIETAEEYIERLENMLADLQEETEEERTAMGEKIEDLSQKFEEESEKNKELNETLEDEREKNAKEQQKKDEEIFDLNETNIMLKDENDGIKEENQKLANTVKEQKDYIDSLAEVRKQEIENTKKECEEEKEAELEEVHSQIKELDNAIKQKEKENKDMLKQLRRAFKEELKGKQNEVAESDKRGKEIKQHYETLVADMKQKVVQSKEAEEIATKAMTKARNELKEVKSQLATANVESKMMKLKLGSFEEKIKREKSLLESKLNMKMMKAEADCQQMLEEFANNTEAERRNFLSNICQLFVNFVDFTQPITDETVTKMLNDVHEFVESAEKKNTELKRFDDEISEIRTMLNIGDNDSLKSSISDIVSKIKEYERSKEIIQNEQEKATQLTKQLAKNAQSLDNSFEWEEWARRVYGSITDNFTVIRDPVQIRYSIEEALMNSIGQRQIWRRMEILRTEKELLVNGLVRGPVKTKKNTFTTLLSVVVSLRRMQKLSGHLPSALSISKSFDSQPQQEQKTKKPKRKPILSLY